MLKDRVEAILVAVINFLLLKNEMNLSKRDKRRRIERQSGDGTRGGCIGGVLQALLYVGEKLASRQRQQQQAFHGIAHGELGLGFQHRVEIGRRGCGV
jgi:hypothetical protein